MDTVTTSRQPKVLPDISSAELLSMRNAVTGWRLHVGLMFPTPAPIRAIREWYEVVPDGVDITPLSLAIRQLTDDNMEMAVKGMEQAAELLSHYDVDMIFQSGVPPIVAPERPKFADEVQSRIAKVSGLPALTDMGAVIEAMKTFNIKTVAMATPFRQFINDRLVKYLAYENISVISNRALGIEKNIEIRRLPIAVEYQTARQAFLDAPRRPDALYIPCGGWGSMHNIELLERDLDTMVISWANVMIWSTMRLGKVNARIERFGKLLASIS